MKRSNAFRETLIAKPDNMESVQRATLATNWKATNASGKKQKNSTLSVTVSRMVSV
jgi:hypothetical protein